MNDSPTRFRGLKTAGVLGLMLAALIFGSLATLNPQPLRLPGFSPPAAAAIPAAPTESVGDAPAQVAPTPDPVVVQLPATATDAISELAADARARDVHFYDAAGAEVSEAVIPGSAAIDAALGERVSVPYQDGEITLVFTRYDSKLGTYFYELI